MLLELMVRLSVPSTICTQTEGMGAGTFGGNLSFDGTKSENAVGLTSL